ncbi:MAG: Rne/Rng family ribonuclease [Telmatospirillum sp.]|nr:Rne/Rng family ribonuclease [Telmatospirillum sp.]
MTKRMLIDSTHPEETRVVVLDGNRLEEFDFETASKKQLKGNIYLARVTRVEPSLQAAFVEFGGNRHGFLAFNEIHPDYYRIPVSDRQALMAEAEEEDERPRRSSREESHDPAPVIALPQDAAAGPVDLTPTPVADAAPFAETAPSGEPSAPAQAQLDLPAPTPDAAPSEAPSADAAPVAATSLDAAPPEGAPLDAPHEAVPHETLPGEEPSEPRQHIVESVGGDTVDDAHETRRRARPTRQYKIQEVLKRRQVLLVQVVKEERGNKGAALTTYLSLAGRYCVLMPNTDRGGGISRRITSQQDRKRLKNLIEELDLPDGMAVILRTAGMERETADIRRDYEYLMRLWEEIRDLTLRSSAPALIYEEGSIVKRAIRDMYSSGVDEILVAGEHGYDAARHFMGMLMPSDVARIRRYDDAQVPLFQRFQVETELDEMHLPTVRLRSGGYIVINSTEALVAIDVNSGRSTRERNIDETAYKTNLEAADEVARQLRLRDLAGLIVIDFIDMDDHRHQAAVERRLKEAMKSDRARIQIGRISAFGLLELSRQRLRPSISEISFEVCPHCQGTGRLRSTESAALHVLRAIEEEGVKLRAAEVLVYVATSVALYLFNNKRAAIAGIESRYGFHLQFHSDDSLIPPAFRIERGKAKAVDAPSSAPIRQIEDFAPSTPEPRGEYSAAAEMVRDDDDDDIAGETPAAPRAAEERNEDGSIRRRRRRGRGRNRQDGRADGRPENRTEAPRQDGEAAQAAPMRDETGDAAGPTDGVDAATAGDEAGGDEASRRRRRRGRRGGRRRGRRPEGENGAEQPQTANGSNGEMPVADSPMQEAPALAAPSDAYAPPPMGRVQGPGDAHDWPWNRRGEEASAPAAAPATTPAMPPQIAAPAEPIVVAPQPAPVAASPAEATTPPPPEDDPNRPKKRGWWNRLTG